MSAVGGSVGNASFSVEMIIELVFNNPLFRNWTYIYLLQKQPYNAQCYIHITDWLNFGL